MGRTEVLVVGANITGKLEGSLYKKARGLSQFGRANWKRRWITLEDGTLKYYENKHVCENGFSPFGTLRLMKQDTVEFYQEENDKANHFTFRLVQSESTFCMYTKTEEERQAWVDALRAHIKAFGK